MAKKKPVKKRTPAKKKTPAKRKPAKRSSSKKSKKKGGGGVVSRVIHKIPEKVRIKGGKAKSSSKNKYGSIKMESEYKDLDIGK